MVQKTVYDGTAYKVKENSSKLYSLELPRQYLIVTKLKKRKNCPYIRKKLSQTIKK